MCGVALAGESTISGAGATFPYPIYSKWFDEYTKVDASVRFNYQSIGSGGGIRQITDRTVDFGASDANPGPFLVGVIYRDANADGAYGVVQMRDAASGALLKELRTDYDTRYMAIDSRRGYLLYSATGNGVVGVINLRSGLKQTEIPVAVEGQVTAPIAVSPALLQFGSVTRGQTVTRSRPTLPSGSMLTPPGTSNFQGVASGSGV